MLDPSTETMDNGKPVGQQPLPETMTINQENSVVVDVPNSEEPPAPPPPPPPTLPKPTSTTPITNGVHNNQTIISDSTKTGNHRIISATIDRPRSQVEFSADQFNHRFNHHHRHNHHVVTPPPVLPPPPPPPAGSLPFPSKCDYFFSQPYYPYYYRQYYLNNFGVGGHGKYRLTSGHRHHGHSLPLHSYSITFPSQQHYLQHLAVNGKSSTTTTSNSAAKCQKKNSKKDQHHYKDGKQKSSKPHSFKKHHKSHRSSSMVMVNGTTPLRSTSRLTVQSTNKLPECNHQNVIISTTQHPHVQHHQIPLMESSTMFIGSEPDVDGDHSSPETSPSTKNLLIVNGSGSGCNDDGSSPHSSTNKIDALSNQSCAISIPVNHSHHHHHQFYGTSADEAATTTTGTTGANGHCSSSQSTSSSLRRTKSLKMILCSYVLSILVLAIIVGVSFICGLLVAQYINKPLCDVSSSFSSLSSSSSSRANDLNGDHRRRHHHIDNERSHVVTSTLHNHNRSEIIMNNSRNSVRSSRNNRLFNTRNHIPSGTGKKKLNSSTTTTTISPITTNKPMDAQQKPNQKPEIPTILVSSEPTTILTTTTTEISFTTTKEIETTNDFRTKENSNSTTLANNSDSDSSSTLTTTTKSPRSLATTTSTPIIITTTLPTNKPTPPTTTVINNDDVERKTTTVKEPEDLKSFTTTTSTSTTSTSTTPEPNILSTLIDEYNQALNETVSQANRDAGFQMFDLTRPTTVSTSDSFTSRPFPLDFLASNQTEEILKAPEQKNNNSTIVTTSKTDPPAQTTTESTTRPTMTTIKPEGNKEKEETTTMKTTIETETESFDEMTIKNKSNDNQQDEDDNHEQTIATTASIEKSDEIATEMKSTTTNAPSITTTVLTTVDASTEKSDTTTTSENDNETTTTITTTEASSTSTIIEQMVELKLTNITKSINDDNNQDNIVNSTNINYNYSNNYNHTNMNFNSTNSSSDYHPNSNHLNETNKPQIEESESEQKPQSSIIIVNNQTDATIVSNSNHSSTIDGSIEPIRTGRIFGTENDVDDDDLLDNLDNNRKDNSTSGSSTDDDNNVVADGDDNPSAPLSSPVSPAPPPQPQCLDSQFQCPQPQPESDDSSNSTIVSNTSECLDKSRICDGIIDCPLDKFDERDCFEKNCAMNFRCGSKTAPPPLLSANSNSPPIVLPSTLTMENGLMNPYLAMIVLSSNESLSSSTIGQNGSLMNQVGVDPTAFRTEEAKCIPRSHYCDGIWDCQDGSDEIGCFIAKCDAGKVHCRDNSACITGKQACDGVYNCRDRSDEAGCGTKSSCESKGKFYCPDSSLCISKSLVCDGISDCDNGADEKDCMSPQSCRASDGKFFCQQSFECIDMVKRCDGKVDCLDYSDEDRCFETDPEKYVYVYNGQRRHWSLLCVLEAFSQTDADKMCSKMGMAHSKNFTIVPISRMLNGSTWAWMDYLDHRNQDDSHSIYFQTSCIPSMALMLECQPLYCDTSRHHSELPHFDSPDEVPTPIFITNQTIAKNLDKEIRDTDEGKEKVDGRVTVTPFNQTAKCLAYAISPQWLLTSGQCLINLKYEQERNLTITLDNKTYQIRRIRMHPKYSIFRTIRFPDYDMALVQAETPLPASSSFNHSSICLPTSKLDPEITCFIGNYRNGDTAFKVLETSYCNSSSHFSGSITERHVCASYEDGNLKRNLCLPPYLPLICLSSQSHWYLAGYSTYQRGCDPLTGTPIFLGYQTHPTLFSNLFTMKQFMEQTLGTGTYNRKRLNLIEYNQEQQLKPSSQQSESNPENDPRSVFIVAGSEEDRRLKEAEEKADQDSRQQKSFDVELEKNQTNVPPLKTGNGTDSTTTPDLMSTIFSMFNNETTTKPPETTTTTIGTNVKVENHDSPGTLVQEIQAVIKKELESSVPINNETEQTTTIEISSSTTIPTDLVESGSGSTVIENLTTTNSNSSFETTTILVTEINENNLSTSSLEPSTTTAISDINPQLSSSAFEGLVDNQTSVKQPIDRNDHLDSMNFLDSTVAINELDHLNNDKHQQEQVDQV